MEGNSNPALPERVRATEAAVRLIETLKEAHGPPRRGPEATDD